MSTTFVDFRRYVGASLAAAGPFFEKDVNQTDPTGGAPINGWPLDDTRVSFSTISGNDLLPFFMTINCPSTVCPRRRIC